MRTRDSSIRFTLNNNIETVVKEVKKNIYDFELFLPNGNRKTFVWHLTKPVNFADKKGNPDTLAIQAIEKAYSILIKT